MKILFIAYEFPPLNIGGAQRPYKFAKYLPEFGVDLVIFTLNPADYHKIYSNSKSDISLLRGLSSKVEFQLINTDDLLKRRNNVLSQFLAISFNIYKGSEGKYWKKHFMAKAHEYLNKRDIDLIMVTAPPFSVLPLAKELSIKYKLPLVVDMRDAWSLWVTAPYSNYFTFLRAKLKEREILHHASKVIVTSEQTILDFKNLHQGIDDSKFVYIPNGYDEAVDFEEISYQPKDKVRIGYVGSFYYSPDAREAMFKPFWKKKGHRVLQYVPRKEDWLYRSPYFFLKSIKDLLEVNPAYKEKIEIHFAGNKPAWLDNMILGFGLEDIIHHAGFLSHNEVIDFQKACDFLLITSSKVVDGKDYSIAGKTFEYFTLKKPILAFVAEGAQKEILIESEAAIIFNPDDTNANMNKLEHILLNGVKLNVNKSFLAGFHRRTLAQKLSNVLKEII